MIREKKPRDYREAEQEALLKNWLDGLESLEKAEVQLALRHAPALSTIEEEHLEAMPSHEPFDVDRPEWILAEELNLGLEEATRVLKWHEKHVHREVEWAKAEQLTRVVGFLIKPCGNLRVIVRSLALATGLAELNGTHSQAEEARKLGVTRSLISYYVTAWADLLGIEVFNFRKASSSRETYRAAQKKAWAKRKTK
jgi:hypothetical protein